MSETDLSRYRYDLPAELVAQKPAAPRDSSRLFVYDTASDTITHDRFSNIGKYLPPESLLVLNDTKVVPARVTLKKETGGKVTLLFLANEYGGGAVIGAMSDRKLVVGQMLSFPDGKKVKIAGQRENIFDCELLFDPRDLPAVLLAHGTMPLPPYIDSFSGSQEELRERYQAVFANNPASVAAPTASLHFTPELLAALSDSGIAQAKVTLHVGMGTFAPVRPDQLAAGKLHAEYFSVPADAARMISEHKAARRPVVAVGTTVVRALESAASEIAAGHAVAGRTEIFIRPPFEYTIVDALVTNFHVPESSLLCLVDAFVQGKRSRRSILDLYAIAIAERYRFFSFGDAMLVT